MSFFGKLFSGKSNKSKNTKKSKKRVKDKESAFYFNSKYGKIRTLAKEEYTVSEFQSRYGAKEPEFKKIIRANVVIMYDTHAPNGSEGKNNKLYIHYLQVNKRDVIPYRAPNPPKGTHHYYAVSLKIDEADTIKKLEQLDDGDRTPDILQKLHDKKKIDNFELEKPNMLKITSFRIKQDPPPKKSNNQSNSNNKSKKKSKKNKKKKSKNNRNVSNNSNNSGSGRNTNTNTNTNTSTNNNTSANSNNSNRAKPRNY